MSDEPRARLITAAREAASNAHAPYSNFAVGAAILLADGTILTAANFENASYGLSLCAETVVIAQANSEGRLRDIVAIAIAGGPVRDGTAHGDAPIRPCGRCRQVMTEAALAGGRELEIHCAGAEGQVIESYRLSDLLPHAFNAGDLGNGRDLPGG